MRAVFRARDLIAPVSDHPWQIWIDLVQSIVLALTLIVLAFTFAALLWYAVETMRQRKTAAIQLRLSVIPMPQVIFHRARDRVFVKNVGRGAATQVILQGFWFSWGRQKWRCTFGRIGGMVHPGQEIVLDPEIESEDGQRLLDPDDVLEIAVKNAWQGLAEVLVLEVYVEDILGNCYKSEVRVSRSRFAVFKGGYGSPDWLLEMGKPELRRPGDCMGVPELLDTTQAAV